MPHPRKEQIEARQAILRAEIRYQVGRSSRDECINMDDPKTLQKQLVIARMAQILGNKQRAEAWIAIPQPDLGGRTSSGAIDDGEYEAVLKVIGQLVGGAK